MATYKVIQDIEAEDKLVGPLTLRQFVYALVAAFNFYISFAVASKGAPFVAIVFFPIGLVCAFFAWPFTNNQPTEIWALAKIRFLVLPRKRVWDQSGVKELVTITAPKKIERTLTNGLSQNEVKSRLRALADTIDTRGWAIKNVNISMMGQPALVTDDTDRLVSMSTLPQPVPDNDIKESDDMLDEQHNPVAQHFDTMMAASAKAHRQEIIDKLQETSNPIAPPAAPTPVRPSAPQNNYWFLNQPSQQSSSVQQDNVTFNTQVVTPGTSSAALPVVAATPTQDEESFIRSHKNVPAFSPNIHGHLHVIQPLSAQQRTVPPAPAGSSLRGTAPAQTVQATAIPMQGVQPPQGNNGQTTVSSNAAGAGGPSAISTQQAQSQGQAQAAVTQARDTAILDLARNDDLNVATIAREAQKRQEPPQDEVVISLH